MPTPSPERVTMPDGKAGQRVSPEALGVRLRAEREARGWTPRKLAERFSAASRARCAVPDVESMIPQIRRWERGGSGVGERYRTLYCVVFGMAGADLFAAGQTRQEVNTGD
jgi:transcriptional regulator with XRE-family HTH domain